MMESTSEADRADIMSAGAAFSARLLLRQTTDMRTKDAAGKAGMSQMYECTLVKVS